MLRWNFYATSTKSKEYLLNLKLKRLNPLNELLIH